VTREQRGRRNCHLLYRRNVVVDFCDAVGDNVGVDGFTGPSRCWWLWSGKLRLKAVMLYKMVLMEITNYHFWHYRCHFTTPFHFDHLNSITALHFLSTYFRFSTISKRILHKPKKKNLEISHNRWCTFLTHNRGLY